MINKGQTVWVKSNADDIFSQDFQGTVIEVSNSDYVVRDGDENCFSVNKNQVTFLDLEND